MYSICDHVFPFSTDLLYWVQMKKSQVEILHFVCLCAFKISILFLKTYIEFSLKVRCYTTGEKKTHTRE